MLGSRFSKKLLLAIMVIVAVALIALCIYLGPSMMPPLWSLVAAWLTIVPIAFLPAYSIGHSLSKISKQAQRISSGKISERVKTDDRDELGDLARTINHIAENLEKKEYIFKAERDRLQKLENMRRDFVANVSHELKTPLTNIQGYLETLEQGAVNDLQTAERFMGKIKKNAVQLQNLIEDLLKLSAIESERHTFNLDHVLVYEAVQDVVANYQQMIKKQGLALLVDIPKALSVYADRNALRQILSNLVDNAIKYTGPEGRIKVCGQKTGHVCEIMISDTGIGISQEDLPHIFERFYRVDKARSRDLGGTGLGLSIVKHLVLSQGGTVSATSEPESGSQFIVELPLG